MDKPSRPRHLTANEYLVRNQAGLDSQIGAARAEFIEAIRRLVPSFFTRLREQVYPAYQSLADGNPFYSLTARSLYPWQSLSDIDDQLIPILQTWARDFNVENEEWILDGALRVLSNWHHFPSSPIDLESPAFRQWIAVNPPITNDEHRFKFEDWGWDPMFINFRNWRRSVTKRFREALNAHAKEMRKLVRSRGAVPAVAKFSPEHFEWLALFQCGNLSLTAILERAKNADETSISDKTTISKGMNDAARLPRITIRSKSKKLKNR